MLANALEFKQSKQNYPVKGTRNYKEKKDLAEMTKF